MKRWWYFASLVVALSAASVAAETASQVFKQVSPSVVVVLTYDAAGKATELGSGVVLPNGNVATNCHVLKDGTQYRVRYLGKDFVARLHFSDWGRDICSLSVAGLEAPPVTLGSTTTVNVGDPVYAIGTPEGLDLTLSQGIVSSLRHVKDGSYIQTTAAISPGSSGGGLFDDHGRLLGLTSFFISKGEQLNFALPVEWIESLPLHSTKQQVVRVPSEMDFMVRAAALESRRDWTGLLKLGNTWTTAVPNSSSGWSTLAEAELELHRGREALLHIQRALRLDARDSENWELLGVIYLGAGEYEQAINANKQAVTLRPSNAEAWRFLGMAYVTVQRYPEGISALRHDLRINPDDEIAWASLGSAYGAIGQKSEEIGADQHAVELNQNDASVWFDLGVSDYQTEQVDQVVGVYQRLKTLSPKLATKLFNCCIQPQ